MYLWKCWRDTRSLFIVALIVGLIVMPTAVALLGRGLLTDSGAMALSSTLFLTVSLTAFALGTLLASEEFSERTIHFLFTKPRQRAYFVWAGWLFGCVQLLIVAAFNLCAGSIVLIYNGSALRVGLRELIGQQNVIGILVYCIILYSTSFSLTAVFRNGMYGLGASIGIVSGLQAIAIVVRLRWHVILPVPPEPIGGLSSAVSKCVWILMGMCLILAAQLQVERAEI